MYASVIVSYNLSASTLLDKKQKDSTEVDLEGEKVYFNKEKGFFPAILEEMIKKRKRYKQEYKDNPSAIFRARSNAFKLLANAAYGYLGFFGARYYCREAAASTAALARKSIHETIDKITSKGYKVVYSDTDSIAFLTGGKTHKQIKELLEKLNSELPGIMALDLEDFYKRGIWVTKRSGDFGAKKKYALIGEDGKMKIRGFETVRRDWCPLARETQNKVLRMILEEGNEKRALEYIKDISKKMKGRKIKRDELLIRTQLKKPISEYKSISPHVVAAKKMQEQNIPIDEGALIEYYIAEPEKGSKKKLVRDRVKLATEEGEYDIEYYLKHQMLPAVENIMQVFKIKIEDVLEKKSQTTLDGF
jgi:DNA polymerase Pol2